MYGEIPYMGSRLLKGLCYVESKFKKHLFFYLFTFKEYSW